MALRWLSCSTAVLLLLVHVAPVVTQTSCGAPGIPGIPGTHGPNGRDGTKGEKGDPGELRNTEMFVSTSHSDILPDLDQQFQGVSLTNGSFVCVIKGVYFFSYHISAKSRVCLNLLKGSDTHMALCDIAEGFLVTSGSAVLELEVGDTVSLQATRYNNIVTSQSSASHTFTGFLIFSTA
ncbi:complement C1q subcomponent subunit B-like [Seriola lalandi dorsalis]|uniref:complement C1q subcomponent subunit B-like n=1 Tax=Seriola lalandi dorsalis TaxID=1841481 RepID=UPI000C6F9C70|nr:complement C1q subcomponent subunit B-like [Seriola lalandi dorsalis]